MSCSRVGGAPIRGGGACCPHLFSPGPSTWFWVSHRLALPPFLYALCVHRLSISVSISLRSVLLCFNHLASLWRVCPPSSPSLSASATLFTSCCSFPPCPVFPYLCLLPTISPLFPLSLSPSAPLRISPPLSLPPLLHSFPVPSHSASFVLLPSTPIASPKSHFFHAEQVAVNEIPGGTGVEGLTVLLHTAVNEAVDFLQVFVDLPV